MRSVLSALVLLLCLEGAGCSSLPRIVILHDPLTPAEHIRLASAYESDGKWDLAGRQYEDALRAEPGNAAALLGLAQVEYRAGRIDQAEKALVRLLRIEPNNAVAENNLAWLYASAGKHLDRAEELATRAATDDPERAAGAYDTLARVYAAKREYDQAIRSVERGLRLTSEKGAEGDAVAHSLNETRAMIEAARGAHGEGPP